MSLIKQLFNPLSTGQAGTYYHGLSNKEVTPAYLFDTHGKDGTLCPIISWNPIWQHRIAGELAAQLNENSHTIARDQLETYRRDYMRMWSTLPLKSNKSFSYFVGACALDALTNTYTKRNLDKLLKITLKLVKDGAFVEGSHYSIYCSTAFDRVESLLDKFYTHDSMWVDVKHNMQVLNKWQSLISNSAGVVASIGDSWYEKVKPCDEESDGVYNYEDMTIRRQGEWVTVENHRKTNFALHEHCHANEVLVAYGDEWIIQGSGMPSYKRVMAKPWRWRRPRNHFFTESKLDWFSIWRLRKGESRTRTVEIANDMILIKDIGSKTARFPVASDCKYSVTGNAVFYNYKGFSFVTRGKIKSVKEDCAWQSGGYNEEKNIKVLRIKGTDMETTIKSTQ